MKIKWRIVKEETNGGTIRYYAEYSYLGLFWNRPIRIKEYYHSSEADARLREGNYHYSVEDCKAWIKKYEDYQNKSKKRMNNSEIRSRKIIRL